MKNCCQISVLSCALRVSVGIAVAVVGLVHYLDLANFVGAVNGDLGMLSGLGTIWAYILPALQIIGGLWFAFDTKNATPGLLLGLAFGSIAIGFVAKALLSGNYDLLTVMPKAQNALLWLLFILAAAMTSKKCGSCDVQ